MTNLGALTTTFIPAPNCTSIISGIVHTQTVTTNGHTNTTTYKYHSLGPEHTSPCFPPAFRIASDVFYSPGICPQGWTSACGSIEAIGTATETRATCCPLGYTCQTTPPLTVTWSTLSCVTEAISVVNVTVPDLANQKSTVVQLQPVINVAAVNVRWQQTDFATETTNSTPSSSSSRSTSQPPSSPSPTRSPPTKPLPHPGDDGGGLSAKAKIGIGVGVGVGGLFLAAVTAFCIWKVRRRHSSDGTGQGQEPPPNNDDQVPKWPPVAASGDVSGEVLWPRAQTQPPPPEMQTDHNRHEMTTLANTHEIIDWRDTASFAYRPLPPPPQTHVRGYAPGPLSNGPVAEMP